MSKAKLLSSAIVAILTMLSGACGETAKPIDAPIGDATPDANAALELFVVVGSADGTIGIAPANTLGPGFALTTTSAGGSPSWIAASADGRWLYATDERNHMIRSFEVVAQPSALPQLVARRVLPSGGQGPTHLSLDPSGRFLLVANYTSGTYAVFKVDPQQGLVEQTESKAVGDKAHLAVTDPTGKFVYIPCLGANGVAQRKLDSFHGRLQPLDAPAPDLVASANGAGPRHLAFSPLSGPPTAYTSDETSSTVTTYLVDPTTGALTRNASQSTLPAGFAGSNTTSEIAALGATLLVANRGHNSLARFRISPIDGVLTPVGHTATAGEQPRSFAVDANTNRVVVANQRSNNLVQFTHDAGELTQLGSPLPLAASPTFVGLYLLKSR